MTSVLNIGGSLLDLGTVYQYSEGISSSDEEFYSAAQTEMIKKASKELGLDYEEIGKVPGRLRRARRAITIAATLAAADGPLPIGDVAAIGVLGVYAGYEIYKTVDTFVQLCIHPVYMAKLYWRVKRDGKWTWKPAEVIYMDQGTAKTLVENLEEEE